MLPAHWIGVVAASSPLSSSIQQTCGRMSDDCRWRCTSSLPFPLRSIYLQNVTRPPLHQGVRLVAFILTDFDGAHAEPTIHSWEDRANPRTAQRDSIVALSTHLDARPPERTSGRRFTVVSRRTGKAGQRREERRKRLGTKSHRPQHPQAST
jgi:hypothetical protein